MIRKAPGTRENALHENILYRIPIPRYINLMVSTYIAFYAKKNSNGKIKKNIYLKNVIIVIAC